MKVKYIITKKAIEIEGLPLKADDLGNYRTMVENSIKVPGPITRHYAFYSRFKSPMNHQVLTADFACLHKRFFIFNDIGTGKTMIPYWLTDYLQQEGEITRTLIIAPLSTLEPVHAKTLQEHFPQLSFNILHGTVKKRMKLLGQPRAVYIINTDGVKTIAAALAERNDINAVFIDEVAALRNVQTQRWKIFNELFGVHTGKLLCGMTGSPMPKDPTDIYGQVKLINPAMLPQKILWKSGRRRPVSFFEFRDKVMVPGWSKWEWKTREGWQDIVSKVAQPSIRYERDECCDLPDRVTMERYAEFSPEQSRNYKELISVMRTEIASGEVITALNEGDKIRKLHQVACGAIYTDTINEKKKETTYFDCAPRFEELCSIIDDVAPSHVLIFTPYKNMPQRIAAELNKRYCSKYNLLHKNFAAAWITGEVSPRLRPEIYRRFNEEDLRFIVATPHCMSHGLNLQFKCWTIVWWSPVRDFEKFEQSEGRITRPGQTKKQMFFRLQGSTTEREIYKKLDSKESAQNILLSILKEN